MAFVCVRAYILGKVCLLINLRQHGYIFKAHNLSTVEYCHGYLQSSRMYVGERQGSNSVRIGSLTETKDYGQREEGRRR